VPPIGHGNRRCWTRHPPDVVEFGANEQAWAFSSSCARSWKDSAGAIFPLASSMAVSAATAGSSHIELNKDFFDDQWLIGAPSEFLGPMH